jgi:hypothetical protein
LSDAWRFKLWTEDIGRAREIEEGIIRTNEIILEKEAVNERDLVHDKENQSLRY